MASPPGELHPDDLLLQSLVLLLHCQQLPAQTPLRRPHLWTVNAAQFRTMYWTCRGGPKRARCVTSQIVRKPILAQYLAYAHVMTTVAITEDTEVLRSCVIAGGIWDLDEVCILHWWVVYRLMSASFFKTQYIEIDLFNIFTTKEIICVYLWVAKILICLNNPLTKPLDHLKIRFHNAGNMFS